MLSIIIPVLNGYQMTVDLLHNLSETTFGDRKYEIIIVDDGSTDETSTMDPWDFPYNLQVIHHDKNRGFAAGCNTGIRASCGDHIAIFNNDMIVTPLWDSVLLIALESDDPRQILKQEVKLGMVGGTIVEPMHRGPARLHLPIEDFLEDFSYLPDLEECNSGVISLWERGAPWLFRREVFDKVGLFDERFYPGNYEDIDMFIRMAIKGWVFGTTNTLLTYHMANSTFLREWGNDGLGYALKDNRDRFVDKWGTLSTPTNYITALFNEDYGKGCIGNAHQQL
jgi:GT2 family glycosyltransferase